MKFSFWATLLLTSAAVVIGQTKEQAVAGAANEVAIIQTSEGDMIVQFWSDAAPTTIENFKKLARSGFYNGTTFHRIMKGFMIQGGDPYTKDPAKEDKYGNGGPGYTIKAEFNHHNHQRGVISMARDQDPDSAGSQFFICLGPVPRLDGKYTTFGELIKGDDVLTKIGNVSVKENSAGEMSKPLDRIVVKTVKIAPASDVK